MYLNNDLKKYYTESLKKEISLDKIDDGIQDYLLSINANRHISPIFSKKGKKPITNYLHSYLTISFTHSVEKIILDEIKPYFEKKFNGTKYSKCSCNELNPRIDPDKKATEYNKGSSWQADPEYFNVKMVNFDLIKGSQTLHDNFWIELEKLLSNVGSSK